ncbi:Wings apart-like protein [Orchesella cincta]|uniref:Wings apart-like protein n=1 Tax=Orchesella cincta TaxID=48709 RepID=A0A1D2MZU7_ORCCI|nr:Wings apart-like protein [Orchesella cincta]
MENSLIAAYISLLLAYLIMDNPTAANQVRNSMPNGQYLPLMIFLKKLFNFMSITSSASGSIRGLKATAIALRFFAQADPKSDEELKKLIPD